MESLVIVFFAAIAGWIWYRHDQSRRRLQALAANGVRARARILGKFRRSRPKSGKRHYIECAFFTGDGTRHVQTYLVTAQEYLDYAVGDQLTVLYDPQAVEFNRPAAYLARKGLLDGAETD
jgi:hypothetical protein